MTKIKKKIKISTGSAGITFYSVAYGHAPFGLHFLK